MVMQKAALTALQATLEMDGLSPAQLAELIRAQAATIDVLRQQNEGFKHQLDWFKRQLFGSKSERFVPDPQQMHLGEVFPAPSPPATEQRKIVPAHSRRVASCAVPGDVDAVPFFDETRVPVQTIVVPNPEVQGLAPEQFVVIGEKASFRLAQRPGSYVVLKYVRPVIKRLDTQAIHCPPAPVGVIDGSRADVSFVAGLMLDKILYHLPLYRQHQRLNDSGITVSRPWLTQLVQQGSSLIEPIYDAQFASVRAGRVKAMDETPIKAGRDGPGKMKAAYFWPIYGELDEVCFPYFPSRAAEHVYQALGLTHAQGA